MKAALRTIAKHVASDAIIVTDAPVDNHGKGAAFSPTDLLSASLGSCMLTVMGIACPDPWDPHGWNKNEYYKNYGFKSSKGV
jgi:hypothetical protein